MDNNIAKNTDFSWEPSSDDNATSLARCDVCALDNKKMGAVQTQKVCIKILFKSVHFTEFSCYENVRDPRFKVSEHVQTLITRWMQKRFQLSLNLYSSSGVIGFLITSLFSESVNQLSDWWWRSSPLHHHCLTVLSQYQWSLTKSEFCEKW